MIYSTLHKSKFSHLIARSLVTENYVGFRIVYRLVKKLNFTSTVKRNNSEIRLLVKNGVGLMNLISNYESWLDAILPKLITGNNPVFIDVGANIGQTMLKVVPNYKDLHYIAIEPNPNCSKYLESLCELNQFNQVRIVNKALSDKKGDAQLLTRFDDDILGTTSPKFRKFTKYSSTTAVPCMSGDELISELKLNSITVLKVDVEGGEAAVLKGLSQSIKKYQPYIICEVAPLHSKSYDVMKYRIFCAKQILSFLASNNYSAINIVTKKQVKGFKDFSSSLESANYLFIPEAKKTLWL